MKKLKFGALALAATIALTGCAAHLAYAEGETPLPVTGAEDILLTETGTLHAAAFATREALIEKAHAGDNVEAELTQICTEIANHEYVYLDASWLEQCESPDFVWNFYTNTWVGN